MNIKITKADITGVYKVQVGGETVGFIQKGQVDSGIRLRWVCDPERIPELTPLVMNAFTEGMKKDFFMVASEDDVRNLDARYEAKIKKACEEEGLCYALKDAPDAFAASGWPDTPLCRRLVAYEYEGREIEFLNDRFPDIQGPKDNENLKGLRVLCKKGLAWVNSEGISHANIPDTLENRQMIKEKQEVAFFINDYFNEMEMN